MKYSSGLAVKFNFTSLPLPRSDLNGHLQVKERCYILIKIENPPPSPPPLHTHFGLSYGGNSKIMSFNTILWFRLSVCLSICLNVSGLFPHIPQTHLHTHFGLNCWGNFKIVSSNIIFWLRLSVCMSVCMSECCSLISRKLQKIIEKIQRHTFGVDWH